MNLPCLANKNSRFFPPETNHVLFPLIKILVLLAAKLLHHPFGNLFEGFLLHVFPHHE
jgi:hypothetical protein